jgi:hypothetical protein
LPPYIAFLYFSSFTDMPKLALDGFKFLLVFVAGSIPAAVLASSYYGVALADCDWVHGSAESLLTITNFIIFVGFQNKLNAPPNGLKEFDVIDTRSDKITAAPLLLALLTVGVAAGASTALAGSPEAVDSLAPTIFGLGVHSPFLGGVGDVPAAAVAEFLGVLGAHAEPPNALSVATWLIHVSSLIEWLVVMGLVWKFADATKNETWRGVTWGKRLFRTLIACFPCRLARSDHASN